ncbi:TPA: MBL fold metallo-hydrolase, partial [Candidatus Sumerlaeota bacterium]|nr:MBL fold metallo-hydrolase [Candidatus Sumerlaeota bacterium]
ARHLLSRDGHNILLDCGLYQGRRKDTWDRNRYFHFEPSRVDAVLLSHAHIDHSGNLPNLVRQGFAGPIWATMATTDLARVMLRDSAFIQEKDAEWLNKPTQRRRHPGIRTIEPLYSMEDAEQAIKQLRGMEYHKQFEVLPGLDVTFYDAGHILGAAAVIMDIQRGDQRKRLAFSGDIGRAGLPLLRSPEIPYNVDWLIMESTYGARTHDPIGDAKEELRQTIVDAVERGGKIVMPSFSVERTQEIVYFLNELYNEGHLPQIPIYVDSPLAIDVTAIFRQHEECYNDATKNTLRTNGDIFGFQRLSYVRDVQQSMQLNAIKTPCLIISASGMCEAGRVVHHLRNSVGDSKNTIVFVGYQAENTLGRKLVERQKEVNILGEPHEVHANIVTLNAFSGHADKNDLFEYARTVKEASPNLKRVFLVHGEEEGLSALKQRFTTELGLSVTIPSLGERIALEEMNG